MSQIYCPKCGTASPQEAAFCGNCGAALAAQSSTPPTDDPQLPPASGSVPPPTGFPPPPPGGYQMPGAYPPAMGGGQVMGNNTKWGLGLGIAGFFCCGPFTAIPGIFMAKKDMDDIAAGRAPQLNLGYAKAAYYVSIVALVLWVASVCLFWGRLGLLRRF